MSSNNPLNIKIEQNKHGTNKNYSDHDVLIFLKMRVKHAPNYLWSNFSNTYKRKIASFLIVEKGETIKLKITQKKRKKKSRRKSSIGSNASSPHNQSLNQLNYSSSKSQKRKHTKSFDNDDYYEYHQYYTFEYLIIKEGGTLTVETPDSDEEEESDDEDDSEKHPKGYLHINVRNDVIVHSGGKIDVSGLGYNGGGRYESGDSVNSFGKLGETKNNIGGGGGSKTYELGSGGGGGYATNGDNGCSGKGFGFGNNKTKYREGIDGIGGKTYGDELLSVVHFGSGGGGGDYGDSTGGNGGGIIIIDCKNNLVLNENSKLYANGQKGKYDSDGCGSGGSIYIKCKSLKMKNNSVIMAMGAKNNLKGNGGNGGDGRIRIQSHDKNVSWNKLNILPRPYIG